VIVTLPARRGMMEIEGFMLHTRSVSIGQEREAEDRIDERPRRGSSTGTLAYGKPARPLRVRRGRSAGSHRSRHAR
jgi:hypothetical protein